MSVADDVKAIFEGMPKAFLPEKAKGLEAVIQIKLSGEGAGDWTINIANGGLNVSEGATEGADMTLHMAASDYVALTRGEANPMSLFAGGKIRLEGDMGLAMKFQQMFS